MSTTISTKRRQGSKLFKTKITSIKPENKYDIEALKHVAKNSQLETTLDKLVLDAENILKKHNLSTEWSDVCARLNDKYDCPLEVSYARDILFRIHTVRDWVSKNDAMNTAIEAMKLGQLIMQFNAELAVSSKEKKRTEKARKKRDVNVKLRRDRIKTIAKEKYNWKHGNIYHRTTKRT